MRRHIAWWLVASLALPSVARAQTAPPTSRQWCVALDRLATVPYTSEQWVSLPLDQRALACEQTPKVSMRELVEAQPTIPTTRMRSPTLVTVGAIFTLAGLGMVIPAGKTYRIFGDEVCVKDQSVDWGSCGHSPKVMLIGAGVLASGITMAVFGSKDVQIAPMLGSVKGAQATVTWGGKKK